MFLSQQKGKLAGVRFAGVRPLKNCMQD